MAYVGQFSIENLLPGLRGVSIGSNLSDIDLSGVTTVELPAGTTLGGSSLTALGTITSTSAQAFAVGRQGLTNPVLNVNANTATVVTGITLVGAASGAGMAIQVTSSASNEALTIDAKAAATITLGGAAASATGVNIGSSTSAAGTVLNVVSSSAASLTVGRQGATTPVFQVDSSTSSQISGLKVTGAATGVAVALVATDSGSNVGITLDGKGTGTIKINNSSTSAGLVTIGNGTSGAGAQVFGPVIADMTPTAQNITATLTSAQVATGYITSTSAATVTLTMPTGTLLGGVLGATQGMIFDLYIDNTAGANTITMAVGANAILSAAAAANAASQGLLTVPSGVTGQACFRLMFSSATAYTFTRIA